MKIIIDTHIFIWALSSPGKLSIKQRSALETPANTVFVSSASVAELMIKHSIGKLNITFDPVEMANLSGFNLLDFTAHDALQLRDLPMHHKDPFDRMLIAQALQNKYVIMTEDALFKPYACKLV
jgi:PIN domain nuclease of toxin-antitoxin system